MFSVSCLLFVTTHVLFSAVLVAQVFSKEHDTTQAWHITNDSLVNVTVSWIHRETSEKYHLTDKVESGGDVRLGAIAGYDILVEELPDTTGFCSSAPNRKCRSNTIPATLHTEPKILQVTEELEIVIADHDVRDQNSIEYCRVLATRALAQTSIDAQIIEKVTKELAECVKMKTTEMLAEDMNYQLQKRKDIAKEWEKYACNDDTLATSRPDSQKTSFWEGDHGIYHTVRILHNQTTSEIHLIENFITPEECQAITESARDKLEDSGVFNPFTGKKFITPNRKAKQARLPVPWGTPNHPFAVLSQRIFKYANHVMHLEISSQGQEPLRHIVYQGRGRDDSQLDQFVSHCDDRCDGGPYQLGRRIATMIMYCEVSFSFALL